MLRRVHLLHSSLKPLVNARELRIEQFTESDEGLSIARIAIRTHHSTDFHDAEDLAEILYGINNQV
ncbi:MAG: hypothetical protein OEY86_07135 [Nitrospira sp.]|nr:hypothetical protein [Nitrospira sp.]